VLHGNFLRSQGAGYHQATHSLARADLADAELSAVDRALLTYAEKLTRAPASVGDADPAALRVHGFDDAQLWEATFTTSLFNLFPRMADAFGLAPPPALATALGFADEQARR
jgi:alkylhydroperoxidase family enzyme